MPDMTRKTPPATSAWKQAVAEHRKPVLRSGLWQLGNSLIPYLTLWGLMIWTLNISYWITLALAVVAAGFLVRIFIIFHDCGHGSFFRSRRAAQARSAPRDVG
jgi:omega-6 fatty acid desaturase (delta-12 desaturase)